MPIVVQKYGGSSVADAEKIRAVAERVMKTKAQGYDVCVVVSAMGDTTDDLLAMAKKISPNPDRRELDMLLTTGERISMALLSIAIRELGGNAISFTGSQSGIVTNDRHIDARIIEVRPFRVQDELARGRIVVIAGYQGVSYRREVTTLGRGGSDTTAVAMAAALGAEWCEICSDVDGVYTADPRVVPAARRIGTLNYEETQEMAEAGAKVLNAQAVEFAKQHGERDAPRPPGMVAGVASEKDVLVLQASNGTDRLLEFLDELAVCGKQLHVAGCGSLAKCGAALADGMNMVFSRENLPDEDRFRRGLAERFGESVRLVEGIGAVSAIGAGINTSYKNVRAGSAALAAVEIAACGISTSSFRISWLLPDAGVEDAVRALHRVFIENAASPVP